MSSPWSSSSSARDRLLTELAAQLRDLDAQDLLRRLTVVEAAEGPRVWIGGRELTAWCSNDYLGLCAHPRVIQAAAHACGAWGLGPRASRLLAGTSVWHARLEAALAEWFGAEAAIVFPSGFLANLGALGALLDAGDTVFMDRLCHASLFDAVRLTRATLRVFRHCDLDDLAALLARPGQQRTRAGAGRRMIITEGVFSMDGDLAPLELLTALADRHDALVYVDDAHGAFALGPRGRGAPDAAGVAHERLLYMATLGKALGCQGGFVIGPDPLIRFLHNRARSFLYSTALAVPVAAAAVEALRVAAEEPQRRQRLAAVSAHLHSRLQPLLSPSSPSPVPSHIVPVMCGESRHALEVFHALWEQGIWAPAIRPPTVPDGTARLRVSVTALHTAAQADALADALHAILAVR